MIIPVEVALGGGPTDSSGNYSFTTQIHPSNWSVVRLAAQTSGSPRWTLLSDNNLPLDFAVGPLASLGLVLVAPGQRLTAQIQAGQPATSVLGHFVGVMSPDLNEVLPYYLPSPNPIGSTTTQLSLVAGSVTAAPSTSPSTSFPIPSGTACIGFEGRQTFADLPTVQITGDQSGIVYFNTGVGTRVQAGLLSPLDTSVTMRVFAGLTSTTTVDLLAWSVVPTAFVRSAAGTFLDVNLVNQSDNPLQGTAAGFTLLRVGIRDAVSTTDAIVDSAGSLRVQEGVFPPLWQAPRTRVYLEDNIAAGPFVLVAGIVGQTIRIFGWEIVMDTAGGFAAMYDNSLLPTTGRFAVALGGAMVTGFYAGMPLSVGAGVSVEKGAAAQTGRWALSYSQG